MTSSGLTVTAKREQLLVATFVELADTLIEDFDVIDFFASLTERVVELGIAAEAGILLVDEAGSLQFMAASNEQAQLLELFQVQSSQGPCHDCFQTGAPVAVTQLEDERERWPRFAPKALSLGFVAVHAFPLRLRDTVLGAMNLFDHEPGSIDHDSRAVVQALADVATIGLLQQRQLERAHMVEGQLQYALHSRVAVEQSKGIIFEQGSVSMAEAFELIRSYSRGNNVKLSDTARRIVEGSLDAPALMSSR